MTDEAVVDRLARLEQHAEYTGAMRHAPKSSTLLMVMLGIALTGGGGVLGVVATTSGARTIGWCLALAGVACLAAAVFLSATPLERVLAVVAREKIRSDGPLTARERRDRKHYLVLERHDGIKREYRASRELARRLEEGDAGVAYLKAGFLLDFRTLR